jgi:hypothetical protein
MSSGGAQRSGRALSSGGTVLYSPSEVSACRRSATATLASSLKTTTAFVMMSH